MSELLGIYGAGGAGRGIMPLLRARAPEGSELVFIDDARVGTRINGYSVIDMAGLLDHPAGEKRVIIAIADGRTRAQIAGRCEDAGVGFLNVRAENVIEMDEVTIGEGAILSPFVAMTSNIAIGRHFHANLYSYVEHDCRIGDFVTFAPAVCCNGNVTIGDFAYIGANAVIRQGLDIGEGAIIGMGAVVTKDVPAGEVWVGSPARKLVR